MSRDDKETSKRLTNPYIEISRDINGTSRSIGINSSTFSLCLEHMIPAFRDNGPIFPETELGSEVYSIYGVVGRTIPGFGSLNIGESPISRTLMGYLAGKILRKDLPKVHRLFNPST
jgi:hypothetical protein